LCENPCEKIHQTGHPTHPLRVFLHPRLSADRAMYCWGNYSDSLYDCKKNPDPETLAKHKEVLENIIEESKKRELRIPPNVSAELGYNYAAQNNNKKAIELFNLEKQIYPESSILMDRLISQAETRTNNGASSGNEDNEKVIKEEKSIGGGTQ
jgi:hypothetical protein